MSKIPAGYKQTEVGVIPEEWDSTSLRESTSFSQGIQIPVEKQYLNERDGRVRFIRIVDYTQDEVIPRYIDNKSIEKGLVDEDTVVMIRYGNAGQLGRGITGVIANNMFQIISKGKINRSFLFTCLSSDHFQSIVKGLCSSTSMPAINFTSLRDVCIPLPPLPEQKRIAQVLGDVDALIQKLEALIAKKRDIKQAAMQELLTGKRRLPGFLSSGKYKKTELGKIPEEWSVSPVRDIAVVGRGRVISHKEIARSGSTDYPVYSSQTSNDGVMGYLHSFDFEGDYITWTTDGEKAGKVFQRTGRFNCTNVCGTIKLRKDDYGYVARALDRLTPRFVSRNLANPKLMNDVMKGICLPLPPLPEQTAIAQVLSDMDSDLAQLETRLGKTRDLKAGLMQQLLTGKIRLLGN